MPNLFDEDTNTQGVIVYGGESSDDYGMVVAEAPAYERPKRKQTIYNVPGRNGSIIFQEDAWEDVNRSYKVWLAEDGNDTLVEKVDAFEGWINSQNGYVRLEDNFEPDVFRLAYYSGGDGFSNNLTQYGEATLNFTCRPERFLKSGETVITFTESGSSITNPTKFISKPLIRIQASGKFNIAIDSIGSVRNEITATVDDYLYIDCGSMNAYRQPNEYQNNKISGDFPVIYPGTNYIYISLVSSTGTFTNLQVTPRYYTI